VTLRRVDTRFLLPEPARSAVVLGGLDGWVEGLSDVGIEVRESGPADLVVGPATSAPEAAAIGAKAVVLEGRGGGRRLRRVGLQAHSFLVRPRIERPALLLPLNDSQPAAYAVRHWSAGYTRRKRARNQLARALVLRGRLPEIEPVVAVGALKAPALPYVVQAAEPLGVPADAGWFLTLGYGDVLSRNVFHLFRRGDSEPSWVLKFARLPGYDESFRRDEVGLALARRLGGIVAERAPRLLGRFRVAGLEASLETAAPGEMLRAALLAPGPERDKIRLIEDVAEWLVDAARETAASPPALQPERERLLQQVVPAWSEHGIAPSLVHDLPPLPAVLQHNDVGCWNVVVGQAGFMLVDWESATAHGLPLWDLVYFLTDALAALDRAWSPEAQDEHSQTMLRGESPRSPLLFGWVDRAARELDIPRDAVGPIVTLGWLHHGLSHRERAAEVDRMGAGEPGLPAPATRLAEVWLDDPALGVEWRAWRDA
jgi:hypothetical protein